MEYKKIIFSQAHFEYICEETLNGSSIIKISKARGMPKAQIIYSWIKRYKCLQNAIKNCRAQKNEFILEQKLYYKLSYIINNYQF